MASQVREIEPGFYRTETGGIEALGYVKEHYGVNPLLGEKAVDFVEFMEKFELRRKGLKITCRVVTQPWRGCYTLPVVALGAIANGEIS